MSADVLEVRWLCKEEDASRLQHLPVCETIHDILEENPDIWYSDVVKIYCQALDYGMDDSENESWELWLKEWVQNQVLYEAMREVMKDNSWAINYVLTFLQSKFPSVEEYIRSTFGSPYSSYPVNLGELIVREIYEWRPFEITMGFGYLDSTEWKFKYLWSGSCRMTQLDDPDLILSEIGKFRRLFDDAFNSPSNRELILYAPDALSKKLDQ